jgi:nitrogen fixation NifU-like protein
MSLFSIAIAFLALLSLCLLWFFIYYFGNPVLEDPDGIAKVVGNCGDTMEIGLKFKDGRVEKTHFWSNGCSFSKNCVETAAILAHNKNISELKKINMVAIMDEVGQLSDTHLHCAQLAEITLQRSLENYLKKEEQLSLCDTMS